MGTRFFAATALVLGIAALAACEESPRRRGDNDDDGEGMAGGSSNPEPMGDGPVIDQVIVSPVAITWSDALTLSVVVHDPDGFGDIGAGRLLSEDGTIVYGVFAQVSEGAYEYHTSWADLHAKQPIQLPKDETAERKFRIEFIDLQGTVGSRVASVVLDCGPGEAACNGECMEVAAGCPSLTPCQELLDPYTCEEVCLDFDMQCSTGCAEAEGAQGLGYADASCAGEPTGSYSCGSLILQAYSVRCCCG